MCGRSVPDIPFSNRGGTIRVSRPERDGYVLAPLEPPLDASTAGDRMGKLLVLMITAFVDMVGFAMVLPLIPFYAASMGATGFIVGLLISSFSVAQLVSAPSWGKVSDHFGRRPAVIIGLLISALAYVVFGLAESLWILLLSRVVQGVGGGPGGG